MHQAGFQHTNDFYMYKFRTILCSAKGKCRHPSTCFDAHSNQKRRVPKYIESKGWFNYIPEPCPQWRKSKTCSLGVACPRSHGWLEIIYHPLLYKTKLCKSKCQNGSCSEYGFYCAKAHTRCEIRSLVDIFGKNWKRHYDLSNRSDCRRKDATVSSRKRKSKFSTKRVGLAVPSKAHYMLDINLFAQNLLEKQASVLDQPRMCPEGSQLEVELWSDSDDHLEGVDAYALELKSTYGKSCFPDEEEVLNYPPSHTSKPRVHNQTSEYTRLKNIWEQESLSPSTDSPIRNSY